MALAGGFSVGDRVVGASGRGTVFGPAARKACHAIAVAVRGDDGTVKDERIAGLRLDSDLELKVEVQAAGAPGTVLGHRKGRLLGPRPTTAPSAAAAGQRAEGRIGDGPKVTFDPLGLSGEGPKEAWGIGSRVLPDRHADAPLGGEVEAGYGIGDRSLPDDRAPVPPDAEFDPLGLSPPRSAEASYGIGNRVLADRHADAPLGGEVAAGYGIGNRGLPDSHAHGPLGGELEAGYGIDERKLARKMLFAEDEPPSSAIFAEDEPPSSAIGRDKLLAARLPSMEFGREELLAARPRGRPGGRPSAEPAGVQSGATPRPPTSPPRKAGSKDRTDHAESILRGKLLTNYVNLHGAFRALDRSNNGYVSRADFAEAMTRSFLPSGFTQDDIDEVARRFGLTGDGALGYQEFAALFRKDTGQGAGESPGDTARSGPSPSRDRAIAAAELKVQKFKHALDSRFTSWRDAYRSIDRSRTSALRPSELMGGLLKYGVAPESPEEERAILAIFDPHGTGRVVFSDFSEAMTRTATFGTNMQRIIF